MTPITILISTEVSGGNVNMPTTKLDKYKALYWVGVSAFAKKMGKEEAVKYFGTMPN